MPARPRTSMMSAHQTSLFELGFPRAARLLRFLTIAVLCTFFYCQLRSLVMLRPQVRLPGPAVRTHSGVGGVIKLDSAYTFIFSDSDDMVYDRLWHC